MVPNTALLAFYEKYSGDNHSIELDPSVYIDINLFTQLVSSSSTPSRLVLTNASAVDESLAKLLMNEEVYITCIYILIIMIHF